MRFTPPNVELLYNAAEMHCSLGEVLLAKTRVVEAAGVLSKAVALDAKNARAHYFLALAMAAQGMLKEPLKQYSLACSLQPAVDTGARTPFPVVEESCGGWSNIRSAHSRRKGRWISPRPGETATWR